LVDAEHVILGAGCAGLSLAVRLSRKSVRERGRIIIVEPRTELGGDRTWCSWRGEPHPFTRAITQSWDRWRVVTRGRTIERGSKSRPYEHVDSRIFSDDALAQVTSRDGTSVRLGVRVNQVHDEGSFVRVETNAGEMRAKLVWDARGGLPDERLTKEDVRWVQHFVGWVVRTERNIFDPNVVTLMDFDVPQDRGPHFVYVLPYAPNEALVEDTCFSAAPWTESEYEEGITRWLEKARAGAFEIVRRERGRIPMSTAELLPNSSSRIVSIGQKGGAAKPSTGYAFSFIQKQCDFYAAHANRGDTPPPLHDVHSKTARFFDRVFLAHLNKHKASAPEIFGALFERTPTESLIRFLTEEGNLRDHLAIMNSMPKRALTLTALQSRNVWLRRP
jgi:lycopene beta-cyclase